MHEATGSMTLTPEEIDFLRGIAIFGGMPEPSLQALGMRLERRDVEPGVLVVGEGDLAQEMFVVYTGVLEVLKEVGGGQTARLALLQPGACFGEMALIDIQPRSAAVKTVERSVLFALSAAALATLWREQPSAYTLIVMNIAREISRRLRRADGLIASIYRMVAGVDFDA